MITVHPPLFSRLAALAVFVGTFSTLRLAAAEREPFEPGRLEKEVLATGLRDCVQFQFAPNGEIFVAHGSVVRKLTARFSSLSARGR